MNKKILISIIIVALIDQFSKFLADFIGLDVAFNTGISFNLLDSLSFDLLIFLTAFFVIVIFILFKNDWAKYPLASGLFFGGSISNILDRILFGAVRDWINIPFFDISNNLADWFIFLGLGLFLVSLLRKDY